jgi:ParB family chromosome partitioning protein
MSTKTPPARLGRGLAALLGDFAVQPSQTGGSDMRMVPLDLLDPNPYQPRMEFDQAALEELADSIRVQGLLQPLLVRAHPTVPGRLQIVAGERRWRAAALAGLHEVPVLRRDIADADTAASALVENLQRQDLNPMEEAEGYHRLVEEFGMTHEAVGFAVSKSRAHVGNSMRLLRLPLTVQARVRNGDLSYGHARALVTTESPEAMAERVIRQGLSVRQTEALVSRPETPTRRKVREKDSDSNEWERALSARLGSRVTISMNNSGGGQMTIHFKDARQLEEIVHNLTETAERVPADDAAWPND